MLHIKEGVDLAGVQVEMLFASIVVNEVFNSYGVPCTITGAKEGVHGRASLHFVGYAIDYRTRHILNENMREEMTAEIKKRLGSQYDVVLHPYIDAKNPGHLHIEFQPKEQR